MARPAGRAARRQAWLGDPTHRVRWAVECYRGGWEDALPDSETAAARRPSGSWAVGVDRVGRASLAWLRREGGNEAEGAETGERMWETVGGLVGGMADLSIQHAGLHHEVEQAHPASAGMREIGSADRGA